MYNDIFVDEFAYLDSLLNPNFDELFALASKNDTNNYIVSGVELEQSDRGFQTLENDDNNNQEVKDKKKELVNPKKIDNLLDSLLVSSYEEENEDRHHHHDCEEEGVHPLPIPVNGAQINTSSSPITTANSSLTFPLLSSNPNATAKIFLDFDGVTTSGTSWNSAYNGGANIITPSYSIDSDTTTFSDTEINTIVEIWQRVAEDYAPFNIDVTTIEPGNFAAKQAIKVAIGGSSNDWYGQSAGGVAYINSWLWDNTPVFVFEEQLGNGNAKYVAEAVSHEVGHSLGLQHQSSYDSTGKKTNEYNPGYGSGETGWAPIMGTGYYKNLTTWSNGKNAYGGYQDDLATITSSYNGFGYRSDDYGDTNSSATFLSGTSLSASGIISTMSDNDVFAFTTGAGNVSFNISVAQFGPNLDVVGELWNGNSLILASNPTDKITASLSTFLEAGTYYLHVKSNGEYGRLGQYNLTGTVNPLDSQNVTYSIAADAASVLEGNAGTTTPLSFTITRSSEGQGLQSSGTVDFSLAGGSATLGTDYSLASVSGNGISVSGNQITFAPGATTAKVNLNVIGDFLSESDESVIVALSNPTVAGGTAFIGNTQASSTIVDEDTQIAINDVSTTEGNARNNTIAYKSVSFTVSLSETTIDTVTVNYATADGTAKAGEDYLAASGTLTFNPGETSKTISVSVRKETVFEADETFYLNLSNPTSATIADSQGTGTILNDDTQTTTKKKIAATSNTIDGTGDGELLQGTQNNDKLVGRNGNDTLIGFDASAGVVEADKLISGKGADLFVLGDANQAYYATEGSDDYAIINDFQLNQQDVIQLHGTAEDYAIGSSPFALEGVGIYLNDAGQNELIGLVNGVTNLDLNSNAFEFV
jgi:hypothetical protein